MKVPPNKRATSLRLSEEARRLMADLAHDLAIPQTAVLELAIRDYAAVHLKSGACQGGSVHASHASEEKEGRE